MSAPTANAPATLDDPGRSWASVGTPTTIFVGMPQRVEFDKIALPVQDLGLRMRLNVHASPMRDEPCRLLVKSLDQRLDDGRGFTVIFQHWGGVPESDPDLPAFLAKHAQEA